VRLLRRDIPIEIRIREKFLGGPVPASELMVRDGAESEAIGRAPGTITRLLSVDHGTITTSPEGIVKVKEEIIKEAKDKGIIKRNLITIAKDLIRRKTEWNDKRSITEFGHE
jgi:hypothetical protein